MKVKQSYGEAYLPDELYDTDDDEQTDTGCDRRDDCGPCVVYNADRRDTDRAMINGQKINGWTSNLS